MSLMKKRDVPFPLYEVDIQNNALNDIQIAYSDPNEIYGSVLGALISASAPYVVTGNTAHNITTNGTLAVRIGNDTSDAYNAIWAPRRPNNGSLNPNVTYENNNLTPCYVAQIGTTKYETVEAALADAQGSGAPPLPMPSRRQTRRSRAATTIR